MKLYYAPGACSLAPHIVLREAGLSFQLIKVDLATHKLEDGRDLSEINPKNYVPVIELDDGRAVTEVTAIIQYLADLKPESRLVPIQGSFERTQLREWLSFIAMEIHKGFGPLWNPAATPEWRAAAIATLEKRLSFIDATLRKTPYLMGQVMTVADVYLFTVLNWAGPLKFDLARWPSLQDFSARIFYRPAVREAMKAEGLVD